MFEGKDGFNGAFEYNTDLFKRETMKTMSVRFEELLAAIVKNPNERLSNLSILSEGEKQRIIVEWNDTETTYQVDHCIKQLFESQAAKTPDGIDINNKAKIVKIIINFFMFCGHLLSGLVIILISQE